MTTGFDSTKGKDNKRRAGQLDLPAIASERSSSVRGFVSRPSIRRPESL